MRLDLRAFSRRSFSKSSRLSSAPLSVSFLGSGSGSSCADVVVGAATAAGVTAAAAAAATAFSFLCFLCFLCFLAFSCFLSFFFFFFFPPPSGSEFLAGDGLGVGLLAFLTGTAGDQLVEGD